MRRRLNLRRIFLLSKAYDEEHDQPPHKDTSQVKQRLSAFFFRRPNP